ncbi:MAG: formylglycine-generating enzyme family protein, partial [Bacteroidales bacterium]|nr:formylglycine-generating enzyme family protein [Candidatus Colimorpha onthohippi]
MVEVSGGTFKMGATSEQGSDAWNDEKPVHNVTLSSYYIGLTEVTQELWQAVMGSNPSYFKGLYRPVENVSWDDCQTFISRLNSLTGKNFRLPTEAEWEFAARGGTKSRGYKYSGSNTLDDVAWHVGNSGDKTHDVGTKAPNELGIYDMSG